jgi:dihydrofolate reductase
MAQSQTGTEMIQMIIALDHGNAIGWSDGALAYRDLKADMKRFKELTTGHTVVMGMNTFLSLGRKDGLPNRHNIVLTRKPWSEARGLTGDNVDVISSLDWVIRQDSIMSMRAVDEWKDEAPQIWIIGGKSVYEEALKMGIVDEIYMTVIHASCEADVVMDTDLIAWKHFIIKQRALGMEWEATMLSHQRDVDFETSYMLLRKMK